MWRRLPRSRSICIFLWGAVGAITDPAFMEQIIADGKVDYVVLARALIADPDLPLKAMNGHTEEIRPCLRCTSCMDGGYFNLPRHCSVNPVFGRDSLSPVRPSRRRKRMCLSLAAVPQAWKRPS